MKDVIGETSRQLASVLHTAGHCAEAIKDDAKDLYMNEETVRYEMDQLVGHFIKAKYLFKLLKHEIKSIQYLK